MSTELLPSVYFVRNLILRGFSFIYLACFLSFYVSCKGKLIKFIDFLYNFKKNVEIQLDTFNSIENLVKNNFPANDFLFLFWRRVHNLFWRHRSYIMQSVFRYNFAFKLEVLTNLKYQLSETFDEKKSNLKFFHNPDRTLVYAILIELVF